MRITDIYPQHKTTKMLWEAEESLPLPECFVGIEVELEGMVQACSMGTPTYWTPDTDGSLRHDGMELISHKIFGKDILAALDELAGLLVSTFPNSRATERCGLHIHIDVSDLTINQLHNIMALNLLMEPWLFNVSGGRSNSIYCTPSTDDLMAVVRMAELFSATSRAMRSNTSLRGWVSDFPKYASVNYHPIETQGSIEYRMASATKDHNVILKWIKVLLNIKRYATQGDEPVHYPHLLSSMGYRGFMEDVMGSTDYYPDEERDLIRGMRACQSFYLWSDLCSINIENLKGKRIPGDKDGKVITFPEYSEEQAKLFVENFKNLMPIYDEERYYDDEDQYEEPVRYYEDEIDSEEENTDNRLDEDTDPGEQVMWAFRRTSDTTSSE